jgi:hypothetical protein
LCYFSPITPVPPTNHFSLQSIFPLWPSVLMRNVVGSFIENRAAKETNRNYEILD